METTKKLTIKDMRKEIGDHKKKVLQNMSVMKADELRQYLDKMRFMSNAIDAGNVLKADPPKKDAEPKKHKEALSESEEEEKKAVKLVEKKVKKVKEEIKKEKKEKPKGVKESHKKEVATLDEIPKVLHKLVKDHMKEHGTDVKKAYRAVKKTL